VKKVRLGKTNLEVTQLGWGGIPLQRVGEEEAVSVIRSVVDMGVDLLDTARAYTTSEYRIGLALRQTDRPVVLSSKSLVRTDAIYADVKESLNQLNVRKISIYHLHAVPNLAEYRKVMGPGGAYQGLLRARQEGLIDHIGITSHNLGLLETAIKEEAFSVIMACYGFLEPDAASEIFPLAKLHDIGVITMKVFSGGVIEEPGPALRFVLQTKDIVPIPGSETIEKARQNWTIFAEGGPLTEEDQETIASIRSHSDRRFCRRCDYCQPCTQEINIQLVLGLRSILKRLGFGAGEEMPWKGLIEKARTCSECGECLKRCPYQLPVPELIKSTLAWYDESR
jgi:uncharacterized protein